MVWADLNYVGLRSSCLRVNALLPEGARGLGILNIGLGPPFGACGAISSASVVGAGAAKASETCTM